LARAFIGCEHPFDAGAAASLSFPSIMQFASCYWSALSKPLDVSLRWGKL
jgi:hypothetical protein